MSLLVSNQSNLHLNDDYDEPRLRRNSTKWVGDILGARDDAYDDDLPDPVPHQSGRNQVSDPYADKEFFEGDVEETSGASSDRSSMPSKIARRISQMNAGRRKSISAWEQEQAQLQAQAKQAPSEHSNATHASLKDLYSYRMTSTVPKNELDKVQEPEEQSLKKCTFQPKTNSKSPAKSSADEVFQRVAHYDVAERQRAKKMGQTKAAEAELKPCTFAPKISRDNTQRISPLKKSTPIETTQRLWDDIQERKIRLKQLEKTQEDGEIPKAKVLTAQEAKELAERMKDDEENRAKKYRLALELMKTPYTPEDDFAPEPVKIGKRQMKELTERLHKDEGRHNRLQILQKDAVQQFHDEHPFRPAILPVSESLIQQRAQRLKTMPTPVRAEGTDVPSKRPPSGTGQRPRSQSSGRTPRSPVNDQSKAHSRAQSAPRPPSSPASGKHRHSLDSNSQAANYSGDHRGAAAATGGRSAKAEKKSQRRSLSQPVTSHRTSPQAWQKETYTSTAHRHRAESDIVWTKSLRKVMQGKDGGSPRKYRSHSQGYRPIHRVEDDNSLRPNALLGLNDNHEAYNNYFAKKPAPSPTNARRNRWLSLGDIPVKHWAGQEAPGSEDASLLPQSKRSSSHNTRGGSPGTSTTARSFTNPQVQDQLLYTHLERRIEEELHRRLEAKGIYDHVTRPY